MQPHEDISSSCADFVVLSVNHLCNPKMEDAQQKIVLVCSDEVLMNSMLKPLLFMECVGKNDLGVIILSEVLVLFQGFEHEQSKWQFTFQHILNLDNCVRILLLPSQLP